MFACVCDAWPIPHSSHANESRVIVCVAWQLCRLMICHSQLTIRISMNLSELSSGPIRSAHTHTNMIAQLAGLRFLVEESRQLAMSASSDQPVPSWVADLLGALSRVINSPDRAWVSRRETLSTRWPQCSGCFPRTPRRRSCRGGRFPTVAPAATRGTGDRERVQWTQ